MVAAQRQPGEAQPRLKTKQHPGLMKYRCSQLETQAQSDRGPKTGETPTISPKHMPIKITHRLVSNYFSRGSEGKQLHHLFSHTHLQVFTSVRLHRRFLLQLQAKRANHRSRYHPNIDKWFWLLAHM